MDTSDMTLSKNLLILSIITGAFFAQNAVYASKPLYECSEPISVGLRTKIYPFMWKDGRDKDIAHLSNEDTMKWSITVNNLDRYAYLGARWNIVRAYKAISENSDMSRLERIVQEHNKRGIEVVLRLIEDAETYTEISSSYDKRYGYSKEYYKWVYSIAENMGGQVTRYMISNELDHAGDIYRYRNNGERSDELDSYVTVDNYKKLLKTAEIAIHRANPHAEIIEHGPSSWGLRLAVAAQKYESNGIEDAVKAWDDFHYPYKSEQNPVHEMKFMRKLNTERVENRVQFTLDSIRLPGDHIYQLHHYYSASSLLEVLSMITKNMMQYNVYRGIVAGEIGYRMPSKEQNVDGRKIADWQRYDEEDHAQQLVKNFAILLGNGINKALYWKMRTMNGNNTTVDLYAPTADPDEFKATKAEIAYKYMTNILNDGVCMGEETLYGRGIKFDNRYNFNTVKGPVSVVWNNKDVMYSDEMINDASSIVNIYGETIGLNDSFVIGSAPVYLMWNR